MAQGNKRLKFDDGTPVKGDATFAAIKAAQRKPIELARIDAPWAPEFVRAIIKGGVIPAVDDGVRVPPKSMKRGRPTGPSPARSQVVAKRNADLLPRLDCQIEHKLKKLPPSNVAARYADGARFRRRIKDLALRLKRERVPRAKWVATIVRTLDAAKLGGDERHVRRVLGQLNL